MSQPSSDKYVYFTVAILKDFTALETLKQDALKHHMIDQPGQLIALRITEYYEMMTKGVVQPVVRVPAIMNPIATPEELGHDQPTSPQPIPMAPASHAARSNSSGLNAAKAQPQSHSVGLNQLTGKMRALRREDNSYISTSPNADQNADEAADYWSTL